MLTINRDLSHYTTSVWSMIALIHIVKDRMVTRRGFFVYEQMLFSRTLFSASEVDFHNCMS